MRRHLVSVTLWVHRGAEAEFREFEAKSVALAARHGGKLLHAARLPPKASGEDAPYEPHLLEFPSAESLSVYRSDPESRALDDNRQKTISRAELVAGDA